MSDRIRNRMRSAVYSMAGIYLLYLAYQLFSDGTAEGSGGDAWWILIGAGAFVLIGGGMLIFGLYASFKSWKEDHPNAPKKD